MTITDAANMALARLGQFRIQSLSENSAEARHVNNALDSVRQSLLRRHTWNFATHFANLTEISGGASFNFEHAYNLPSDYLQAIAFNRIQAGTKQCNWKIANNRLYTNDGREAEFEYVRDVTDASEWSPDFYEAFTWFLAAAIAPSINNNPQLAAGLLNAGETYLSRSATGDALETELRVIRGVEYSHYQAARSGGFRGNWMLSETGPPGPPN